MRDFTLDKYRIYLAAISNKIGIFLRFDNYIKLIEKPEKFCLIRHDVDRKPNAALEMAKIEQEIGIVYAIGSFLPSVQWNTSKNYQKVYEFFIHSKSQELFNSYFLISDIEPLEKDFFNLFDKSKLNFDEEYLPIETYT